MSDVDEEMRERILTAIRRVDLRTAVFMVIGAASVTHDTNGLFRADRAGAAGEALLAYLTLREEESDGRTQAEPGHAEGSAAQGSRDEARTQEQQVVGSRYAIDSNIHPANLPSEVANWVERQLVELNLLAGIDATSTRRITWRLETSPPPHAGRVLTMRAVP